MELRNYANECYMRVRRNDLRKDIENGYISHEQANQYLAEYAYELKYPDKKPDKTVIQFITDAITSVDRKNSVILETKKLILSKTQENYYMNRVKKGGLFRG